MKDNYDRYRVIKSQEEYYDSWSAENMENLTPQLKADIYAKYVVKALVFQRDGFKCKNEGCKTSESKLTLHHIKFKKNNGQDKVKNGATVCKLCHQGFHRGKNVLTFDGATYKLHKTSKVDWKTIRSNTKTIRKENREFHGITISWDLLRILMRFLEIPFYELAECDDD